MDEFNQFTKAHTCKETLLAFRNLRTNLGLERTSCDKFFDQFGLGLNNWKVKKLFEQIRKRFSLKEYKENRSGDRSKVLVVGAGPCGLRIAIEAAFLGCEVVLIDKRNAFSRNNVLHLWPYVVTDLKNLGIKHFYSRFGCGELDHISIRRLQLSLLKIALIVGVEIHTEVEFKGLRYPKSGSHEENGWHCVCQPSNHMVSEYKFDVLIAATGARDALCEYDLYNENDKIITKQGFERKEFRGQLSIAITANFVNENTTEEIKAKEIGGVASHFNQKLFNDLKRQKKIHLENVVYYKDETHYFVMTAKKSSLLERGVFKDSCKNKPEELMQKTNVNVNALLDFARDAANFCTHNAMPNLQFAKNSRGAEDVAMLDFSSKFEAVNASRIIERHGHQLLICLVGDSLLEPFWPQGTGCARGFLGAMDSAWMIKKWKVMKARPFDIIAERESIYKVLSQTNPDNLNKKYSNYTVDPKSRYLSINLKAVGPDKAEQYYDNYDTISEQNEDLVDEGDNSGPPSKRSKSSDEIDLTDLLSWCQMVLKGYPFFSITDLTTSWRSGCELGRLIHTYRPELINLTELDPRNPLKTMSLVVDIAQKQLGIYSIIGISEMVNCSTQNEVEMASYLFQFYEMFHHEPIPQTGPTEHADMNINMNMDTIESPDTERKEVQSSDICCICRNELFILEKITVEQNMFCHRTCLKCDTCQCELNLTNYRLKRSTKGNVKFYCSRHARPGSVFKSFVRKRVYPGNRLSNKPKPSGMDNETSVPHVDNKDESLPDPVKDNPRLPERPDFLARTVTSASLRRVDFYNSRDDENDEPEEKIFQHNFGASIRGGRGMFAVVNQEQEMEEKSSSSGDDDIGELVEANIDKHVTDIDKHMTIKDANTFWQTLKRQTYKQNVVKYMETASGGSDEIPQRGKSDVYDWDSTEDKHNDKTGDKVDLSQLQPISDEEDMSADQRDNTQSDNIRRNSDLLEKRIKELNRESKELKDRRYKFSATCYRPARKLAVKEGAGDYKPSKVTPHKKPHFKRSNSDQTEVRHAQRVQFAARKLARQRQENAFFLAQEIARQLEEAEIKLEEVEKEGVEIEKALKEDIKTPEKDKPKLRRMLCSLYSRRQTLLQYEAELRAANEQYITSHIVIQKDEVDVLQSISSDDDEEGDYVMVKNPNTLETGLNKQTTPAMAKADITHDATERNKSSSPNTASTERTTAPPIDRTNKPTNRGITGVAEDTHVYDTGNGSNTPFNEEQNLIDEFQNIGIVPDDWECPHCTLKNKEADFYCDACLAWKCSVCTFVNVVQQKKCKMCENNRPSDDQSEDNRSGNLMPKFT